MRGLASISLAVALGLSTSVASAQPAPAPAPAPPAPAPPAPAPAETLLPLSTQGTSLVEPPPPVPATAPNTDDARLRALEDRLKAQDAKLAKLEAKRSSLWDHLTIAGWVQPQLVVPIYDDEASPNRINGALPQGVGANDVIAKSDGSTTNGTMFRLRRTRLRVDYETGAFRFHLVLDPFPTGGSAPGVGTVVREVDATGKIHWSREVQTDVAMGLFVVPFRYEMSESSVDRPFIERTTFSTSTFPLLRDLGVHARTTALQKRVVLDVAVVNGQPLSSNRFVQQPDLNKSKDLAAWLSYDAGIFMVGANAYVGRGQVVDGTNLRFKQYGKWGANYFAQVKLKPFPSLGTTRVLAELALTQNMDLGQIYPWAVPAIPATFTDDVRDLLGRAIYARIEQDFTKWFLAGYRFDTYTPDTAIKNNARDTHSLVTVVRFSKNLRWMNEAGWAIDNIHALGTPPPSKGSITLSSVLQASF